jgi:hypothetical protein
VEFVADDLEVGRGCEGFAQQRACLVDRTGVVRTDKPGESGLGVVGRHADWIALGSVEALAL